MTGWVLWSAGCWCLGEALLRSRPLRLGSEPVLAAAAGTALVGQGLFVLGLLGQLRPLPVFGGFVVAVGATYPLWRPALAELRRLGSLPAMAVAAASLPAVALALYPSTGFDANLYHLPYAEAFVESGRLEFLPYLRFPVFPQHGEMGFVVALLAGGSEIGAHLTQVWALVLTAGLLLAWAKRRDLGPRTGPWSAALWLGTPLALWIGSAAYIDVSLTLWVTAGLFCFDDFIRTGDPRRAALAGFFIGFAAATKYLGLFFVGVLGLWALIGAVRRRGTPCLRLRPAFLVGAMVLLVAGPWYLRIYALTGNPLFPFYEPLFGASEWTSFHDRTALQDAEPHEVGGLGMLRKQAERVKEGLGFLVTVPWRAVFDRGVFRGQAPLSPFYLVLLPLGLPLAVASSWARPWVAALGLYVLFWLTTVRDLRFLLVILPLLGLLTLDGLDRLLHRSRPSWSGRRWTAIIAALLVSPSFAYGGYKLWQRGPLPTTEAEERAYLSRRVPAYDALLELRARHGSDYRVYGFFAEHLHYLAGGTLLGDWSGPNNYYEIRSLFADAPALHQRLTSIGADYLLIRLLPKRPTSPPLPPTLFEPVASGADYRLYRLIESRADSGDLPSDVIFRDNFESGRLVPWTLSTPGPSPTGAPQRPR